MRWSWLRNQQVWKMLRILKMESSRSSETTGFVCTGTGGTTAGSRDEKEQEVKGEPVSPVWMGERQGKGIEWTKTSGDDGGKKARSNEIKGIRGSKME